MISSRVFLTLLTGGVTLFGVILFTPKESLNKRVNFKETAAPALIQKALTRTPSPASKSSFKHPITSPNQTVSPSASLFVSPNPTKTPVLTPPPTLTPPQSPVQPSFSQLPPLIGNQIINRVFYTSSHWKAKYYYCDTDSGWKALSSAYLKSFSSPEELLKSYPTRILHEPCKQ